MNYERMGIYVTIAIMVGVLGIAGISSGEFDIGVNRKMIGKYMKLYDLL